MQKLVFFLIFVGMFVACIGGLAVADLGALFDGRGQLPDNARRTEIAGPAPTAYVWATKLDSAPLPTPTPDNSIYYPSYDDLARNTEQWTGRLVSLAGQVIQVMEDGKRQVLRVNITKTTYGWEDTILVVYDDGGRLLDKDVITLVAEVKGRVTYKTVLGAEVTVPQVATRGNLVTVQK
jgi:hypothetical protein